jgi:4-oxalocrotonate tautomerase
MPLVDVSIVAGRTPEQIRDLIDRLTDAVEQALDVPRPSIRVLVRELPATHWAAGGETIAERERGSSPAAP